MSHAAISTSQTHGASSLWQSLSNEEIEALKDEIVSEVVDRIPIEDFIQSEVGVDEHRERSLMS